MINSTTNIDPQTRETIDNDFNEWWFRLPAEDLPDFKIDLARMAFFAGIAYANRADEQDES